MADTVRSVADLLALLFQDGQASGSISPQDMRDLIVSLQPPHGEIHLSSVAETTINVAGTYEKAAGGTTLPAGQHLFTMPANNRLRYDGAVTQHFMVMCAVSFTCLSNNQDIGFRLGVDGATESESTIRARISTGTDIQAISLITHLVDIDQSSFIELFVTNETSTANVQIENMTLIAFGISHS